MLRWIRCIVLQFVPIFAVLKLSTSSPGDVRPRNVVVSVGRSVTFPLTYSPCNWDRIVNKELVPIYHRSENLSIDSGYYSLNLTSPGQCDLTVNNVTFSDAGIYQYGNGDAHGFEMFVTHENPTCFVESDETDSPTDGSNITLGCSFSFSNNDVRFLPNLNWQLSSGGDVSLKLGTEKFERNRDRVKITSLFVVPRVTSLKQIVCFVQLKGIPPSSYSDEKVDQNEINFNGHCEVERVPIPVRNVKIQSDRNIRLGDTVWCSAEGRPEVNYYWTRDGVRVSETPNLILDTEGLYSYECFAYNIVHGRNQTASSEYLIFVRQDRDSGIKTTLVLSSLALVCVVAVVLLILRHKFCLQKNAPKCKKEETFNMIESSRKDGQEDPECIYSGSDEDTEVPPRQGTEYLSLRKETVVDRPSNCTPEKRNEEEIPEP